MHTEYLQDIRINPIQKGKKPCGFAMLEEYYFHFRRD